MRQVAEVDLDSLRREQAALRQQSSELSQQVTIGERRAELRDGGHRCQKNTLRCTPVGDTVTPETSTVCLRKGVEV
jgi:hypothetical protein